jgi:hypothetical protein
LCLEFKNRLLLFDGNARPVSYVEARSGYRVDESGFSGIGVAGDSDSNGRGNPAWLPFFGRHIEPPLPEISDF